MSKTALLKPSTRLEIIVLGCAKNATKSVFLVMIFQAALNAIPDFSILKEIAFLHAPLIILLIV